MRFTDNRKLARYLTNWCLYLFSLFLRENENMYIGPAEVRDFFLNNTVVLPEYRYDVSRVSERFIPEEARGILDNSGRIICDSEDLLKRLVFQLRLILERERDRVVAFAERTSMEKYFVSPDDFKTFPNEYILHLPDDRRLMDMRPPPSVSRTLFAYTSQCSTPYFFSHPIITMGYVVLCQNVESIKRALEVAVVWREQRFNATNDTINVRESVPYYLFTLAKSGVSKLYQVGRLSLIHI